MKKTSKKFLLAIAMFFSVLVVPISTEAKSVMGGGEVIIDYTYKAGPYSTCNISGTTDLNGGDPISILASVEFIVHAYNDVTGSLIAENEVIPQGTQVRFDVTLNNSQTNWFESGRSYDSPNGIWTDSYPGLIPDCLLTDDIPGPPMHNVYFKRPNINFTHSGSSAAFSCNGNGSLCTVTSAGTLATSINFSPARFFPHGKGLSIVDPVAPAVWGDGIEVSVPALTYPINVSGPSNQPPNPPTITGPTSGAPNTAHTFNFQATDPNNDTIRYGIDWDNNGSIDQWTPSSGYVASNTQQSNPYTWTTPGTYTFQALTQDSNGASSGWGSYGVSISAPTCQVSALNIAYENLYPVDCQSYEQGGNSGLKYCRNSYSAIGQTVTNAEDQTTFSAGQSCIDGPYPHAGNQCYYNAVQGTGACTASAPTTDLQINTSNGPLSVALGDTLNITWTSTNATSCTAYGAGWGSATPVATNGSQSITATTSDNYIIQCTDGTSTVTDSVQVNLTNSLKLCENSCSAGAGYLRGTSSSTGSLTIAPGNTRNLVACFNPASSCTDGSGNVTSTASWSGANSSVALSGTDPRTVTGTSAGSATISASYSGQTANTNVTVSCVPTVSCSNAPNAGNYCENETFTIDNGCGVMISCNGTKSCNYNWKEVAP
jgi:hypothetical protein